MNEFLAQIYGTSDALEKTAQSVLLSKLAEDEGIDLSGLSGDQLEEIAQSVLNESENEGSDEELSKEAQENIAEADFLGRVMAHSMTQEIDLIKQAGFGDAMRGAGRAIKSRAGGAYNTAKEVGKKGLSKAHSGAKRGVELLRGGNQSTLGSVSDKGSKPGRRVGNSLSALKGGFGDAAKSEARKSLGARAGAGAALGAGGYGAHKAMSKEASAFETLATQRAMQMLQEQGYDVDGMQQQQEQYAQPQQQQYAQPQLRAPQYRVAPQLAGQSYSGQGYGYGPQEQQGGLQNQAAPQGQAQMSAPGYEKVADPMEHFWGSVDERAYQLLGDAGYLEDSEVSE